MRTGRTLAIDASPASWVFDLPEASPTFTGRTFAVDASSVSWAFSLPEATGTNSLTPAIHGVDASTAEWEFVLPNATPHNISSFPNEPRFLSVRTPGGTVVDLAWSPPVYHGNSPIIRYEVAVTDPAGVQGGFEPTAGSATSWRVRGLARGHRYGFSGPDRQLGWPVYGHRARLRHAAARCRGRRRNPSGQLIPLDDADRQSLIVRLAGQDCRVRVWWQPSDESWWATLEVPANTPVVRSRRLAVDTGLLDREPGILPGNVVCRSLGGRRTDPPRSAWAEQTHGLFWEAE